MSTIDSSKTQLFFGRRKGRGFRNNPYARILERLESLSVQRWQGQWPQELWLEIGFGSGEHLCQWLVQHPTRSVIGVEVFLNGLVHCVDSLPEHLEDRCAIFSDPIQALWPLLSESLLDGVILFFPDPWPKRRHQDRRMVQPNFLDQCAYCVKPGGAFHFASDHNPLIQHTLKTLHAHPRWHCVDGATSANPELWPSWPGDWPSSRYRDKALEKNIPCAFSIWQEKAVQKPE
jgi:tRNA (guanine-N7-)-methyltransferase